MTGRFQVLVVVVGCAAQITQGGKTIFLESFGYLDPAGSRSLRTDDVVCIYSMSKSITTTAAMMLMEDGRLGLDDPVSMYIPEFAEVQVAHWPEGRERTAETIKCDIGTAYQTNELLTREVKGRDILTGIPKTITINSDEVREALSEPLGEIVDAVRRALEKTPPELAADIVDKGIVIAGGGALLRNIDVLLREETGLPVSIAEDPMSAVVIGSGKALDSLALLRGVALQA